MIANQNQVFAVKYDTEYTEVRFAISDGVTCSTRANKRGRKVAMWHVVQDHITEGRLVHQSCHDKKGNGRKTSNEINRTLQHVERNRRERRNFYPGN